MEKHSLRYTYAQILRSSETAGLFLNECLYRPGGRMPWHWHDLDHFYLVLQGSCTDDYGQKAKHCRPATLMFHPAGEGHATHYHDAGARTFTVQMEPGWRERLHGYAEVGDHPREFTDGLPAWLAIRLYHEFREPDAATPLAIEGLTLALMAEASRDHAVRAERTTPCWLRQARELLHDEFAQSLSLDAIAQGVGVHPAHLAREFHRYYRRTIGDYLRDLRLEYARRALATSNAPLAEIAAAAGFFDQSHFSRVFKRHTGLTPAEFRRHFGLR
jgi:AraC family transcriptional regulator